MPRTFIGDEVVDRFDVRWIHFYDGWKPAVSLPMQFCRTCRVMKAADRFYYWWDARYQVMRCEGSYYSCRDDRERKG